MDIYQSKETYYYSAVRYDMLELVPEGIKRVLDVGCGEGSTSFILKDLTGAEITGIELFPNAAQSAEEKLDSVILGNIEYLDLDFPDEYFDCIICADVLEHLKDPWQTLRKLKKFLSKNGVLIASIPNIRYITPVLKIIFDRLEYESTGILDKTHLKFFTLHTIKTMFKDCGYEIIKIRENRKKDWKIKLLSLISFGLLHHFGVIQYRIVAK